MENRFFPCPDPRDFFVSPDMERFMWQLYALMARNEKVAFQE